MLVNQLHGHLVPGKMELETLNKRQLAVNEN